MDIPNVPRIDKDELTLTVKNDLIFGRIPEDRKGQGEYFFIFYNPSDLQSLIAATVYNLQRSETKEENSIILPIYKTDESLEETIKSCVNNYGVGLDKIIFLILYDTPFVFTDVLYGNKNTKVSVNVIKRKPRSLVDKTISEIIFDDYVYEKLIKETGEENNQIGDYKNLNELSLLLLDWEKKVLFEQSVIDTELLLAKTREQLLVFISLPNIQDRRQLLSNMVQEDIMRYSYILGEYKFY